MYQNGALLSFLFVESINKLQLPTIRQILLLSVFLHKNVSSVYMYNCRSNSRIIFILIRTIRHILRKRITLHVTSYQTTGLYWIMYHILISSKLQEKEVFYVEILLDQLSQNAIFRNFLYPYKFAYINFQQSPSKLILSLEILHRLFILL